MNEQRRKVLKSTGGMAVVGLAASAGVALPAAAQTWNKSAFETKSLNDTVKAMGGSGATQSGDIQITSPDIAENGAVVPFTISSRIPKTESIALLVEKNPNVLAASFDIPAGTEASVTTRVKMGQTSNINALVKADGKFYYTTKEVKVTIGGCGG